MDNATKTNDTSHHTLMSPARLGTGEDVVQDAADPEIGELDHLIPIQKKILQTWQWASLSEHHCKTRDSSPGDAQSTATGFLAERALTNCLPNHRPLHPPFPASLSIRAFTAPQA